MQDGCIEENLVDLMKMIFEPYLFRKKQKTEKMFEFALHENKRPCRHETAFQSRKLVLVLQNFKKPLKDEK